MAEDIAQDVCLSLVRALPRYQARGLPFLAFVHRIAAHRVAIRPKQVPDA